MQDSCQHLPKRQGLACVFKVKKTLKPSLEQRTYVDGIKGISMGSAGALQGALMFLYCPIRTSPTVLVSGLTVMVAV